MRFILTIRNRSSKLRFTENAILLVYYSALGTVSQNTSADLSFWDSSSLNPEPFTYT